MDNNVIKLDPNRRRKKPQDRPAAGQPSPVTIVVVAIVTAALVAAIWLAFHH